jgi:hypothetical protein
MERLSGRKLLYSADKKRVTGRLAWNVARFTSTPFHATKYVVFSI